jgi:tetratricopeptide (TPR) repeat protein
MKSAEPLHVRLKRFRIERGLTQKELAEPRFTAAYMSILESGRRQPSPGAISYLAERLGVGYDELATGRPRDLAPQLMLRLQGARALLSRGERQGAIEESRAIRDLAGEHSLVRIESKAVELSALIEERGGNRDRALELYEEAEVLLRDEPLPVRTEAIAGQARCLQMLGDLRYAIHLLETHLAVLERGDLPDPLALMRVHAALVWPYTEAGLTRKASEAANAALQLEAAVDDPARIASMHLNAARSLLDQGRPDDAMRSLERAEELYTKLEWDSEVASAYLARGMVMVDRGDLEHARELMDRSLKVLEASADEVTQARALNELASVERSLGDKEAAGSCLQRAISLLGDNDIAELAMSHRELGLCYWTDEPELAEKHLREAVELYRRAERPMQQAATFLHLGDLFEKLGDRPAAAGFFREGLQSAVAGR